MSVHNLTDEIADAIELAANDTKLQPSAQKVTVTRKGKVIEIMQKMANGKTYVHVVTVQRVKA